MLKLLIIGHRGVGKSSFAKRWRLYFPNWSGQMVNLDTWIEKKQNKTILEIFRTHGEESFRKMEESALLEIAHLFCDHDLVVDVGGGYSSSKPKDFKAIWLQRRVDLSQAQFLDRPNLDGQLKISQQRYQERQLRYSKMADFIFELDEGEELSSGERSFIQALVSPTGTHNWKNHLEMTKKQDSAPWRRSSSWTTTLLNDQEAQNIFTQPWHSTRTYEWRDDLISHQVMEEGLANTPQALVSLRLRGRTQQTLKLLQSHSVLWDWPLEWGANSEAPFLSLHKRKDSLLQTLKQLPDGNQKIKLAIPIQSFSELEQAYHWYQEHPQGRSFLPSSHDGRWQWFRLLTGSQMPLGFLRNGQSAHLDQPTLLQVLNHQTEFKNFAAILGSPVLHSLTPSFHRDYFKNKKTNTLAIDLKEDEFDQALRFLKKLGLTYAAVTSPLKEKAGLHFNQSPLNTLYLSEKGDKATSTDAVGFEALLHSGAPTENVVVWGGGGVLSSLRSLLHGASFFSSRTGQLKSGTADTAPQHLIWAVGARAFANEGTFPPERWTPKWVSDLNYTLDSPAIAYAHKLGCQYQSGLIMFKAQAQKQQEFWDECEP